MTRWTPILSALLGGALLALMIAMNSQLYLYVSPLVSSWIAHGMGAITALLMLLLLSRRKPVAEPAALAIPWWAYLGGVSGAVLVVLAVITVNSFLGITGTLVLSIVGQVMFGLFSDQFGWFGLAVHPVTRARLLAVIPIVLGSFFIVVAKGLLS
ncbi:DMT family transporter [Reinekea marinisedimentorum]|uniref:Transporter family-2 protein n=1 Tax=Reinekea marinisedimentorum TaxID=230495 RepID=A0A4R3IBJ9_9GAMM|nr:DMT family transporter [Reinekea marinisedimentorum]TCS44000.1 transporter family-2 protein [Reinekea marinisedimentorum]